MIIFQKFIHRIDLKRNPTARYVFGDNDQREGMGGQAKEMRGEPNAIGIRVKKAPKTGDVYYTDKEYEQNIKKIEEDIQKIVECLQFDWVVVLPTDGIGTGLARLIEFAPNTLKYINTRISKLTEKYSPNIPNDIWKT